MLGAVLLFNLVMFDLRPLWKETARLDSERAKLAARAAAAPADVPVLAPLRAQLARLEQACGADLDSQLTPLADHPAAALLAVSQLLQQLGFRTLASEQRAAPPDAAFRALAATGARFHHLHLHGSYFRWQAFLAQLEELPCRVAVLTFNLERNADGSLDITCLLSL